MSTNTGIEWTQATWNPIRGCSRVSEGCRNCYAEKVANRFKGPGQPYEYAEGSRPHPTTIRRRFDRGEILGFRLVKEGVYYVVPTEIDTGDDRANELLRKRNAAA